jgi:acetate---CoA ligase (ADP-forming)
LNFTPLFHPDSMAVIGVSLTNDSHPANVIYNKLHLHSNRKVYPVNPKGGRLYREKVYPDISNVPQTVDHAVIATRSEFVPDILLRCIKSGVKSATIISGGFGESGRGDLQEQLTRIARKANFPFIGPNCLGIYSPGNFDTFFLPGERLVRPEPGNVAFISQSGGVLVDQMVKFAGQGVGLSLAVSIGNKAVVRELDLLDYLVNDPVTDVIAFYVEGFEQNEGRKFVQKAKACGKPVVVLKAGKSSQGVQAIASHTASLAGDYSVFSQVLAQHGIAEAKNEYELTAFCEALSCYPKSIKGKVAIISISGGHGVLALDTCLKMGLEVPTLRAKTREEIYKVLSKRVKPIAALNNPIDLTGSADDSDFTAVVNQLGESSEIDCILLLLLPYSPGISSDIGARLSHVTRSTGKPLVAYVPHVEKYRMVIEGFELNRVPVSSSIEGAVLMAEAMRRCAPC